MKRFVAIFLLIILVFSCTSCGNKEKQDSLLNYINNDMVALAVIEEKFIASYESVTGDNYSNDLETYYEFTTNTIILARELSNSAIELAESISDEEILEVHRIYVNYCSKNLVALNLIISALEQQDMALMSEANEKLNEANNLVFDYRSALNKLANTYGVELEK